MQMDVCFVMIFSFVLLKLIFSALICAPLEPVMVRYPFGKRIKVLGKIDELKSYPYTIRTPEQYYAKVSYTFEDRTYSTDIIACEGDYEGKSIYLSVDIQKGTAARYDWEKPLFNDKSPVIILVVMLTPLLALGLFILFAEFGWLVVGVIGLWLIIEYLLLPYRLKRRVKKWENGEKGLL